MTRTFGNGPRRRKCRGEQPARPYADADPGGDPRCDRRSGGQAGHAARSGDPGPEHRLGYCPRGPRRDGKTTLIRTLCPGRGYITDETVAITGDNTVLPYPKPLSVRREPSSPWKDEIDPLRFGVLPPAKPATLAAVVCSTAKTGMPGRRPCSPCMPWTPSLSSPLRRLTSRRWTSRCSGWPRFVIPWVALSALRTPNG